MKNEKNKNDPISHLCAFAFFISNLEFCIPRLAEPSIVPPARSHHFPTRRGDFSSARLEHAKSVAQRQICTGCGIIAGEKKSVKLGNRVALESECRTSFVPQREVSRI